MSKIDDCFCLQHLVSVVKFIAERGTALTDDEKVGSPRNFFQKNFQNFYQVKFQKTDAMFLVTGFATVSQIANQLQRSCCITKFCYT